MNRIPSLREIEKTVKKIKLAIAAQEKITKGPNPYLTHLEGKLKEIRAFLDNRSNPANALRCSLPHKLQKKLAKNESN